MNVIFGKCITETIPASVMSSYAMGHNIIMCIGMQIVYLLGAGLPSDTDFEGNLEDEFWRVIWISPVLIGITEILLLVYFIQHEPIAFCIMNG